jgi:hypothetical protein
MADMSAVSGDLSASGPSPLPSGGTPFAETDMSGCAVSAPASSCSPRTAYPELSTFPTPQVAAAWLLNGKDLAMRLLPPTAGHPPDGKIISPDDAE